MLSTLFLPRVLCLVFGPVSFSGFPRSAGSDGGSSSGFPPSSHPGRSSIRVSLSGIPCSAGIDLGSLSGFPRSADPASFIRSLDLGSCGGFPCSASSVGGRRSSGFPRAWLFFFCASYKNEVDNVYVLSEKCIHLTRKQAVATFTFLCLL